MSVENLLNAHVHDEQVRNRVKKVTDYFQACNRREQTPMSANQIVGFLMKTVGGENPRMPKAELSAIVLEIVEKSMRPYEGRMVKTRSPTARDMSRTSRKQTLANLRKYR